MFVQLLRYIVVNEPYNPAGTLTSRENQIKLKGNVTINEEKCCSELAQYKLNFTYFPYLFPTPSRIICSRIEIAEKHNIYILSDEVYRFLEHNSQVSR